MNRARGFCRATSLLGLIGLLVGCAPSTTEAPARADLAIELVRGDHDTPPSGPQGACWASDTIPAVIETVTEQVRVADEKRDAQGKVTAPAAFETRTHQRMVQDRQKVWFRAPCPPQVTVNFVASLQRALKARGLYLHPVTGSMDAVTAAAIRRYQADRGLDSAVLSLTAAQELGLIATALDQL